MSFISVCKPKSRTLDETKMSSFKKATDDLRPPNPMVAASENKENESPNKPRKCGLATKERAVRNSKLKDGALKPSSLQLCIKKHDSDSNSGNLWDHSDSEAAPASSWSTLPNRSLICRPLPVDIGRCTCVIVKESSPDGFCGGSLYSLYTYEGQGRQNRKLAVAHHRRRNGKSEFRVAQNFKGLLMSSEEGLVGNVTANLMGSKYHIWDQGTLNSGPKQSKLLSAVVRFSCTVATWIGSYRRIKAWLPKHQSMQLKSSTTQIQHINGLPIDWQEHVGNSVHLQLLSRVPHFNKIWKQYELDYRDGGIPGLSVKSSVKNFQLMLENNGRQTILQLGRVGKSKYVMDYRYPLTGYQAFCISLASIDSKLCCMV
ncbi:hypothetical protein DM860_016786 [Cuscuta australis]|uniref:Tubby C-terminal domain-containing protein n=1 Tax=Cuscuta australis TaxID=267555 RepID=A0A328DXR4_9ASTE|nr:hypothetical protein DM860_016786 [Cuscuta australis]